MTDSDNPEWWAWRQQGARFALENQDGDTLYVVMESGADLRGTWYYQRHAGIAIGPVGLGESTSYGHPSAEAAKAAAEADYRQIMRLAEWFVYMVNNRPPA